MATDEQLRAQLISVYPTSANWKERVNKMGRAQLFAIIQKFKSEGKLK